MCHDILRQAALHARQAGRTERGNAPFQDRLTRFAEFESARLEPLLAPTPAPASQPTRFKPPTKEEFARLQHRLKETYKAEFESRDPATWATLARRFHDRAQESSEHSERYVLLFEASNLAASSGDVHFDFAIIDELCAQFDREALSWKLRDLKWFVQECEIPSCWYDAAVGCLMVADEARLLQEFGALEKVASMAEGAAARTKDRSFIDTISMFSRDVRVISTEGSNGMRPSGKQSDSSDDRANLWDGCFLCFVRAEWPAGLPFLQKCKDRGLREIADAEAVNPKDGKSKIALGDGWTKLAERADLPGYLLRTRAKEWYREALENTSGIDKEYVEKRLRE